MGLEIVSTDQITVNYGDPSIDLPTDKINQQHYVEDDALTAKREMVVVKPDHGPTFSRETNDELARAGLRRATLRELRDYCRNQVGRDQIEQLEHGSGHLLAVRVTTDT